MRLSVKDAAGLLNVSEKTIYRWIQQEVIPVYRVNEQLRFNRAELLEWATSRRIQLSPQIVAEPESANGPQPSLTEALTMGGIAYHVGGTDKPTVLRNVIQAMSLPETVDRELIYEVMLARETLGSTGIGDGIAIPHVRNPMVLDVQRPLVCLCFLEHPIDFEAIDSQPVHTLFSLVSPTVRDHLHLLSGLGFLLQDRELRDALQRQPAREEILDLFAKAEARLPAAASVTEAGQESGSQR
jgi:PTS system nitrogen regulatory IIA component